MNLEQQLLTIERSLWTNDAGLYASIFLPDAVIIFPELGRVDLNFALEAIRAEQAAYHHWAEVDLHDVHVLTPAPDVALLQYAATARWNYMEQPEHTLCASLYVKRQGRWRVAYHQQTAAG